MWRMKAYIILVLLLLGVVVISSSAAEPKDNKKDDKDEGTHKVAGYGGGGGGGSWGGCRYGCCGYNNWGGCRCCNTAKEAIAYMESTEAKTDKDEGVHDVAGYGGGGCRYGCCGYNNWGGCRCCNTAKEAIAYMKNEAKTENAQGVHDVAGYGEGGGGCRYGCCGYNNWGGCRCCNTAIEAIAYMKNEAKKENVEGVHDVAGYGGGGGGCRYGCCGHNNWGGCKCCNTAKEAIAYMKSEAKP